MRSVVNYGPQNVHFFMLPPVNFEKTAVQKPQARDNQAWPVFFGGQKKTQCSPETFHRSIVKKEGTINDCYRAGWRGKVVATKGNGLVWVNLDPQFVQNWQFADFKKMIFWHRSFHSFEIRESILEAWDKGYSSDSGDTTWVFKVYN